MKKQALLSFALLSSSIIVSSYAQDRPIEEDSKLQKYHSVLLKRPESTSLFEKFYSTWLSKYSEESLEDFLNKDAAAGGTANKQIYAYYLIQRGKEVQALETLTKAIQADEKNESVYLDRSRVYGRMLDFEKAVVDLDKALALESDNELFILKANKLKGRFLTRQGKADEAVAHWSKLADDNPDDQELIEDVIDILMGDALYVPALAHAEKLRANTKDPYKKALRSLRVADILQKKGDRDKALNVYQESLDVAGASSWLEREVIAQVEKLYRREDNTQGLKAKLEEFSKKYPQRLQISQQLADLYSELNLHKDAHKLYLDLIKRAPNTADLKNGLLQALEKAQDYKASEELLKSMIELLPDDAELHVKLAEVYVKLEDKENALKSIEEFVAKSDKTVPNALRKASMLRAFEYKEEAENAYQQLALTFPQSDEAKFVAAEYFVFVQKKELAKGYWEKLSASEDIDTVSRLLEVLLTYGEKELAMKIVNANKEKLKTQRSFISVAGKVCEANANEDETIYYAEHTLQLANTPIETDSAIQKLTKLLQKYKRTAEYVKGLEAGEQSLKKKFLYASLLDAIGDNVKSNKIIGEIASGEDISALLISAQIHERRYDLNAAAETIEKILTLPGGLKSNYLKKLCGIYQRFGDQENAEKAVSRWKKLTPNDKSAWLKEVELLTDAGNVKKALESLRKGVERFEDETDVYAKLASLYFENSEYVQASHIYWRLYDNSKDLDERLQWAAELAKTASEQGNVAELVDKLSERRRTSPQAVAPILALAQVYQSENRFEERRNLLLEASRLRPNDAVILLEVADSDLREGQRDSAIKILKKAQGVGKSDAATRKLAKLYFEDDDYQTGLLELEKLNAGKVDARSVEATVFDLMSKQAFDEARSYVDLHFDKFPSDGRIKLLSSIIDYEMGFVAKSFDGVFSLLENDFTMDGVTQGWTIANYSRGRRANPFDNKNPSEFSKSVIIAPSVASSLAELSGVNANNNSRYGGYNSYGRVNRGTAVLPSDKSSLKLMARLHACRILQDLDEEKQKQFTAKLERAGENDIALWRVLAVPSQNQKLELKSILSKNLEDGKYLSVLLSYYTQQFDLFIASDVLEKFKQNKEHLSKQEQTYLSYCASDEVDEGEHLQSVVNRLKNAEEVEAFGVLVIFRMSSLFGRQETQTELPDGSIEIIERYLKDHPDADKNLSFFGGNNPQSMDEIAYVCGEMMLLDNLYKSKDYKKIVAHIDSLETSSNQVSPNYYGRTEVSLENVQVLLKSVSFEQTLLLEGGQGMTQQSLDFKELVKEIDGFSNPILKHLITLKADENANTSSILAEAEKNEKYKTDALILKASAAFLKEEPAKNIVSLLEQAKASSRDRDQRGKIDRLIVQAAMSAKNPDDLKQWDEAIQSSVKSAARRLMLGRVIVDPNQIQKTITALNMQSEQHRFLTKSNKAVRSAVRTKGAIIGATARVNPSSHQSGQPTSKVETLLKKGQKVDAVRELANEFKKRLGNRNSRYELDQYIDLVKKNQLEKDLLDKLSPKESVSPRKWLIYYQLSEALGNKKESTKALEYLKSLEVIPQSVRMPIAFAMMEKQPKEALKLLKSYSRKEEVFQAFSSQMNELSNELWNFTNNARTGEKVDFTPLDKYLSAVEVMVQFGQEISTQEVYLGNTQFGYHYQSLLERDLVAVIEATKDKRKTEYVKRLEKLSIGLGTLALLDGSDTDRSFQFLYQEFKKANKLDELEGILLRSIDAIASIEDTNRGGSFYSRGGYEPNSRVPTRIVFIGQRILKQKKQIIPEKTLNKLKKVDAKLSGQLKFVSEHVLLNEKELSSKIKAIKEEDSIWLIGNWDQLLNVKKSDSLDVTFAEKMFTYFLSDQFHKTSDNTYYDDEEFSSIVDRLVYTSSALNKQGKSKVLKNFLTSLAVKTNTEEVGAKRFAKWLEIDGKYQATGQQQPGHLLLTGFISKMITDHEAVKLGVEVVNEIDFPIGLINSIHRSSYNSTQDKTAEECMQFLADSGFLAKPGELKVNVIKQPSDKEILEQLNVKSGVSRRYDSDDMPRSDWQVVALLISDNDKVADLVVEKLREIKDERKLSAQLTLFFIDEYEYELSDFCANNKKAIQESPDSFKQILVDVLQLNSNAEYASFFKANGLAKSLPLNHQLIEEQGNVDLKNFLNLKAPLQNDSLYSLANKVVGLIQPRITEDPDACYKIIDHYIDLIKGSPNFKANFSSSSGDVVNVLQKGVIDYVVEPLKDAKVEPVYLLKLVYHLQQRDDQYLLGIRNAIHNTRPNEWRNYRVSGEKYEEELQKTIKNAAEEYASIEDPSYAEFYKTAWFVYLTTHTYYNKLYGNFITDLKGDVEKENEFLDWIHNGELFSYRFTWKVRNINSFAGYRETVLFSGRDYLRDYSEDLLEDARTLSNLNQLIVCGSIFDRVPRSSVRFGDINPDIVKFTTDAVVKAVDNDPKNGVSQEVRNSLLVRITLDSLDQDSLRKYALACAVSFEQALKELEAGENVHRNHIENLAVNASLHEEGYNALKEIVSKRVKQVEGLFSVAQVFLTYGDVDLVASILPEKIVSEISPSFVRVMHSKKADEALPKLLDRYNKPESKMLMAMYMLMPDNDINNPENTSTYLERVGNILNLAKKVDDDLMGNQHVQFFLDTQLGNFRMKDQGLLNLYYTAERKTKENPEYFITLLENKKYNQNIARALSGAIQHAVHRNDIAYLNSFVESLPKVLKMKDLHVAYKAEYINAVIRSISTSIDQLYGYGDQDEKVVELLALYRSTIGFKALTGPLLKNPGSSNISLVLRNDQMIKYIHFDLGKGKEFAAWYKKNSKGKKNKKTHKFYNYKLWRPTNYEPMLKTTTSTYFKPRLKALLLDTKPLMLRLVNNPEFQKDVVTHQVTGGMFDNTVDLGGYNIKDALALLDSGEIKVKVPSFSAVIHSDKAHLYSLLGDKERAAEQYKLMNESFAKHPTPNPSFMIRMNRRAMFYLFSLDKKEIAKTIMPDFVVKKMTPKQKKEYMEARKSVFKEN